MIKPARCRFDLSSFFSLIDLSLSLKSLAAVHSLLIKLDLSHHTLVGNRLLGRYSRFGAVSAALQVFDEIPSKNTFTWNILLSLFCKSGLMETAHRLFDEMPERDHVSWNSMISGYASVGLVGEAFVALYRMQELGVRPSGFTHSIAASCVSSAREAKQVHGNVVRNGSNLLSTVIGNSVISMYGRSSLLGYACRVFRAMEDPDIVSWNSVISAFGNAGEGGRALEWFCLMRASGLWVDEFTLSIVISVCANLEDLAKDWTIRFGSSMGR